MSSKPNILKKKDAYIFDYPQAEVFTNSQMENFWLPTEMKTEKDVQDMMVYLSESEQHGVITVLKLFTLYELSVGNEYWGGKVKKYFQRPEIRRMAATFAFFELGVHAPFYNQINEALLLNNEEFYLSYTKDATLKARMGFIDDLVASPDLALSLGAFSMVEGAVLYSAFAFLKHFQQKGKNRIPNIVAGINFSVKDENIHAEAGAWLYRTLVAESNFSEEKLKELQDTLIQAAIKILEHETRIIQMMFEKGRIDGITEHQMVNFVKSRLKVCLNNLEIKDIPEDFIVTYNPIAEWFYDGINTIQFHDFFVSTGSEYSRDWSETRFVWTTTTGETI